MENIFAQKIQALWRGYNLRKNIKKINEEYQQIYLEIENSVPAKDISNYINIFERVRNILKYNQSIIINNSLINQIEYSQNIENQNDSSSIEHNLNKEVCCSEQFQSNDSIFLISDRKYTEDYTKQNILNCNSSENSIKSENTISYINNFDSSHKILKEITEYNKLIPENKLINSLSANVININENAKLDETPSKNIFISFENIENCDFSNVNHCKDNFYKHTIHENTAENGSNLNMNQVTFDNLDNDELPEEILHIKSLEDIYDTSISETIKNNQSFTSFTTISSISDDEKLPLFDINFVINNEIDPNLDSNIDDNEYILDHQISQNSPLVNLINDEFNEETLDINQVDKNPFLSNLTNDENISAECKNIHIISNNQLNDNIYMESQDKTNSVTKDQLIHNISILDKEAITQPFVTYFNNDKDSSKKIIEENNFDEANLTSAYNFIFQNNESLIKNIYINEESNNKLLDSKSCVKLDKLNAINNKESGFKNDILINNNSISIQNDIGSENIDGIKSVSISHISNKLLTKAEINEKRLQIVKDIIWVQREIDNRKKYLKESRK